jgi:hypothetical protein
VVLIMDAMIKCKPLTVAGVGGRGSAAREEGDRVGGGGGQEQGASTVGTGTRAVTGPQRSPRPWHRKPTGQSGENSGGASEVIAAAGLGRIAGRGLCITNKRALNSSSSGQCRQTVRCKVKSQVALNKIVANRFRFLLTTQQL